MMRRIAVIGATGVGKSTLAAELGRLLGLPVHHLDALYWGDTWTPPSPDDWEALQDRLLAGEAWVIDGNFSASLSRRLAAADTVVYLDASRLTATMRATKRRLFHRWHPAPGVAGGARPMFDLQLLRWIWAFPRENRPGLLEQLADPAIADKAVILRNRRDVRRFLASIAAWRGDVPGPG
jgi:adenylate kinase family enzyme